MSDDKSISLVNLGKLSKPADTLIKKVSDAVGGVFAPYQVTRMAKAEAEASLIKVNAEIQGTDLHRRAMHRFVEEEAKRQYNIESITSNALPLLDEEADPAQVEGDWITNFFDKCRIISDDEMQMLWSAVLSGEANTPGTYSKRTVNFLSSLDKTDASLFRHLLGFGWAIGSVTPLVFDITEDIYSNNGINFDNLSHLESIGLIRFNNLTGFIRQRLPRVLMTDYFGQNLELKFEKEEDNDVQIGKVLLTRTGQELAQVCGSKPIDGFMDYVKKQWAKHLQ